MTDERVLTWQVTESGGQETSWVELGQSRLSARGEALGTTPRSYRLTYELETAQDYVTTRLRVVAQGAGETRRLDLRRTADGWTVDGVPRPDLADALDCDLGLCPLTNTMPILRHGLHEEAGRHRFLMAFVAVPELVVEPSWQTYTHLGVEPDGARVRYESGDFRSDLLVDHEGLVLDYPQLATRI
ncbi:putative glycolipid-binding domain-containing protein [Embleya sp. NPDC008237]|uniref:putative glycolipid-binding domain-containing protein n=1 Tax=unclassified Embleya TaxID=2699296 RepID=UPI0036E7128E